MKLTLHVALRSRVAKSWPLASPAKARNEDRAKARPRATRFDHDRRELFPVTPDVMLARRRPGRRRPGRQGPGGLCRPVWQVSWFGLSQVSRSSHRPPACPPAGGQGRWPANGQAAGERVPAAWERPGAGLTAVHQPAAAPEAAVDRN
jgi:hypothetical protein